MKKFDLSKIISLDTFLSLIFGAVVFVFFAFLYPFHLNYQEQYQLFLYTSDYFLDFFGKPGGIANYLGTFVTQFYFYSKIGALIIAFILTFLQRVIYSASQKLEAKSFWIPITFVPSLLYWNLFCDENYLAGGMIAMLLLAASINGYIRINSTKWRIVSALFLIPVLYWGIGGAFLFFTLFTIANELIKNEIDKKQVLVFSAAITVLSLILPLIAKAIFLQYPMGKFWVGVNYFRYPVNVPLSVGIVALLIFFIPLLLYFFSKKISIPKTHYILFVQLVIIGVGGFSFIRNSADFSKEEVMAYDFHTRMRKWDRIIALADKSNPTSPLSVTCLNLALAKQDLLSNQMFSYYQNGTAGLIPDFIRDFTIPMMAGEVYYHLGLVNTAQRFAFEAMEALPDYQKSARTIKRLAETNIINGDYEVAKKYLNILKKTLYYRSWAKHTLEQIKDESLISEHIEWGWLRKVRIDKDFLFSEAEKENMLGLLFTHNPENQMAFDYLMAICLLNKDLQHFVNFYPLSKSLDYKVIPKTYQEALIYIWELTNNDPTKKISYPVSDEATKRLHNYKRIYSTTRDAKSLNKDFGDTYWYYLHFNK
ncbi:DUF6057 family protein [Prolixibacteraceae bacterium Z1-6]|uniref:DUF6057 family protein n=1 Tax=Draconibacterium aestuarii TaxID=2998507 RepID=A0A9X3J6R6_9BACT|nr:DUF6057 family protein [Prolixibacteraceae bacterium Z1-6]